MNQKPAHITQEQNATHLMLTDIRVIYFIGIGGIGMSAIARYFASKGAAVSGYDRHATPLTAALQKEGIEVHFEDNTALIPASPDLVVYTPAIGEMNQSLAFCREKGFVVVKRSDILQWITEQSFNICVGGSHGKTSISSMTAHILRDTGYGCNAFLGGIAVNYNSNFWSSEENVSVIEADEYDRSFLKLSPDIAVVTAMDSDHLDIYGTAEQVEQAYIEFAGRIKDGGCLISKYGLKRDSELNAEHHLRYSLFDNKAHIFALNLLVVNGAYHFDISYAGSIIKGFQLGIGGLHNIENMVAAVGVACYLQIEEEKIKAAVAAFQGVKRRFEYYLKNDKHVLIDDYAHHPEEIAALISGIRSLYSQKLTIVFQPHLYSRTKDMAAEFAEKLDLADEVILLPIYPAREAPMEGVSSALILEKMKLANKRMLTKEEMLSAVQKENPPLLALCGAGDIAELVIPVKNLLVKV